MKAVVLRKPGCLEVADIPEPILSPGQVLVRVRACGICGSDLRYLAGENPWAQHTLGLQIANPPNVVLGHEIAGDVVAVGDPSLEQRLGERVGVLAYRGCGRCFYCQRSEHNLCPSTEHIGHGAGWQHLAYNPGGMAELCPVWADKVYQLPDHVSYEEGALLDGIAVAVHATARAQLSPGDWVVIVGCGPIGLLALQLAQMIGARAIAADVVAAPLRLAERLGAEVTVDLAEHHLQDAVDAATAGIGAAAVLDSVASPEGIAQCMGLLRKGGRQVLLAIELTTISLPLSLLAGERVLTVSANNNYTEYEEGLRLLAAGRVNASPLVTHRFPLERALEAFDVAARKAETGAIKVVLCP